MKKILLIILVGFLILSNIGTQVISLKNVKVSENIDTYDMVIITPDIFSETLQPLIDHKNSYGIKTFVKATNEIFNSYGGRDEAEKIKYFIKDAIESFNIDYVLLFGGKTLFGYKWNLPARYANIDDGFGHTSFISDLYFADIYKENGDFEDWDSNGNGIFAEWGITGDELDLIPDVSVGRLPCRSSKEASIIVDKIISYEKNTNGHLWFKKMIVIGGDTFPNSEGYEGESTCEVAASYMENFDIIKLFTSTGSLRNSEDFISAFNQGCGFLFTRGRGGQDRIRMVYPEGDEFIAFENDEISLLHNDGKYPICILGECIHGKFDVGLFNIINVILGKSGYSILDCVFECIAWKLIIEKNAGAIGVITNTNICYGAFGDDDENGIIDDAEKFGGYLGVECFRLYGQEDITILGDLHKRCIQNYCEKFSVNSNIYDCKSVMEFILLGDPSLQIGGYS